MIQLTNTFTLAVLLSIICLWMNVDGHSLQIHKIHHLPQSRIVGGKPVHPQIIPYFVRVNVDIVGLKTFCGGSLISDRHVLTAAHCLKFFGITSKIESLQFGPHRQDNEDEESFTFETSDVSSAVIHPQRTSDKNAYDLGIIKLGTPLNLSLPYVGLAKLPDARDATRSYAGEIVQAYGMGQTSDKDDDIGAKELMGVNMTAVDHDTCYALMKKFEDKPELYDNEICTSGIDNSQTPRSSCHGDSGGPLVYNGTLIGVTSRLVIGYCTQGEPNVYVGVGQNLQWIKEQMNAP